MTTVDKTTLTKRQIETLEAVFHTGNLYRKKAGPREAPQFVELSQHGGGAVDRMVEELRKRHYITTVGIPAALTVKGLEALGRDKAAMRAIDERELQERIAKRREIEAADADAAARARAERDATAKTREAESRKTRVAKLRELFGSEAIDTIDWNDERLLAFAAKVADIELIY